MRAHIVASSGSLVLVDWPALAKCSRLCSCDSRSITLAGIWRQINLSYSYVSKCIKHSSYWKLRLHRRALKLARLTQNQLDLCARHAGVTGKKRYWQTTWHGYQGSGTSNGPGWFSTCHPRGRVTGKMQIWRDCRNDNWKATWRGRSTMWNARRNYWSHTLKVSLTVFGGDNVMQHLRTR